MAKAKKTEKTNPHTQGKDTILQDNPVAVINGKAYPLRPLGVRDTIKLARIMSLGMMKAGQKLGDIDLKDPQTVGMLFMSAVLYAEDEVLDFLAYLLEVSPAAFDDPTQFPIGSELEIIEAMTKQVNVRAFFTKLLTLAQAMPEIPTP